jgi:hypothetical protein
MTSSSALVGDLGRLPCTPRLSASHEGDNYVLQARDRCVAGQYANRTSALSLELEPQYRAAAHQGSSRIASRALALAQRSSRASSASAESFDSSSRYAANSVWDATTRRAAVACASLQFGASFSSNSLAVMPRILAPRARFERLRGCSEVGRVRLTQTRVPRPCDGTLAPNYDGLSNHPPTHASKPLRLTASPSRASSFSKHFQPRNPPRVRSAERRHVQLPKGEITDVLSNT